MVITKREDVTKQGFCKISSLKKTPSSGKSLISTYSIFFFGWGGGGGGWEGEGERGGDGRLLTFSAFRMGAYSNKYGYSFKKCMEVSLENLYEGIGA